MTPISWFLLLVSKRLGTLRKIDDQFHKDDLSVRKSFSQSAKKESTRNILIAIDLEKSDRRHFGSLSTSLSRRRSFFSGKLNYYCNSHACFQLQRHVISGDIHPNPGPVLGHNSRRENIPTRKLKVFCWSLNARSVANKGQELISRLTYKPCDLVAITETWLDQSIESSKIFTRSFQVHRRDRTRHGGGILLAYNIELGWVRRLDFEADCEILVHRRDRTRHGGGILLAYNIELGCVRRLDFETDCEILWCEFIVPSQGSKFLVGVFYRLPSSDVVYLSELQKSLSLIDRSGTNLPLLLLGGFNLPNITWGEVPKCHEALSAVLCEVVDDYFLQQMVSEPTRRGNILDLIFTNTPEFLLNINVCEGLGNSDHFSIEFDWKIKLGSLKQTPRFVYNFRTADWDGLREDLVKIPWDTIY